MTVLIKQRKPDPATLEQHDYTRENVVKVKVTYLGYSPGAIDGADGKNTQAAIRAFQADYGLTVDGIPGAATQKMLIGAIARTAVKVDKPISSTPQKTGTFWDGIKYFKREEFRCPCRPGL